MGTYGVALLVMDGQKPAVLPPKHLKAIKAREGADGLIVLPGASSFQIGKKVIARKGSMAGYRGLYEGMSGIDRAKVLMDFFGRKTTVLVPIDDLELE